jgi:hypothetical protein
LVLAAVAWIAGLVVAHYWLVPAGVQPASLLILSAIPLGTVWLWRRRREPARRAATWLAQQGPNGALTALVSFILAQRRYALSSLAPPSLA